jgi:hypothetical protein
MAMRSSKDAETILADLLAAGAIPVLVGERLKIEAPRGVLTPERRRAIDTSLPELRAIVAGRWRSRGECVARRPCRKMSICAEPSDGRPCLAPATCCVCGADLSPGSRYLCSECQANGHEGAIEGALGVSAGETS